MNFPGEDKQRIARPLLEWARVHGRHNLPWQQPATPYRVWISEIMLQQTQVSTVIPYFERFIKRFPDLAALAKAPLEDVLALWSGLGYYARARNLHRAAQMCCEQHDGHLPESLDELIALPGIGRSTAGAIMALGFGERAPILDGNVKRVLARYHAIEGWPGKTAVLSTLWDWAERETPDEEVAAYTQAIMDLGATLCTRTRPACDLCPLAAQCAARLHGNQTDYPAPKPRRARPRRETTFAWVEADGLVLFEQRPPSGIWGGLLCLPEIPASQNTETWCREWLCAIPNTTAKQSSFEHEFTHFRLAANVLKIEPDDSKKIRDDSMLRWLRPEAALSTGLPAPIRRYIEAFLSEIQFESEVET